MVHTTVCLQVRSPFHNFARTAAIRIFVSFTSIWDTAPPTPAPPHPPTPPHTQSVTFPLLKVKETF